MFVYFQINASLGIKTLHLTHGFYIIGWEWWVFFAGISLLGRDAVGSTLWPADNNKEGVRVESRFDDQQTTEREMQEVEWLYFGD